MKMKHRISNFIGLITGMAICFSNSVALAQQCGTMLAQTTTFIGATRSLMEIDVAGELAAAMSTRLVLEFGADGNGTSTAPNPTLPGTVKFTVSTNIAGSNVSKEFPQSGGYEDHVFNNKVVSLDYDRDVPGLYYLTITHVQGVAPGMVETWRLELTGLPEQGVRAIGYIEQGTFKSLRPAAICEIVPAIRVDPLLVYPGVSQSLTVTSSGGFDLSQVTPNSIEIIPSGRISNIRVIDAAPSKLTLSFDVSKGSIQTQILGILGGDRLGAYAAFGIMIPIIE